MNKIDLHYCSEFLGKELKKNQYFYSESYLMIKLSKSGSKHV